MTTAKNELFIGSSMRIVTFSGAMDFCCGSLLGGDEVGGTVPAGQVANEQIFS